MAKTILQDGPVQWGRIKVAARAETVVGSHGDAKTVDRAFEGARAVFWLPPPNPRAPSLASVYADFARPACAALIRHGVERVVGISALGRGTPLADRAGLVTASLAMDDLIASTGISFRALVMPSFMDNLIRQADHIRRSGAFFAPVPSDLKVPTCATADIAEAAVDLLLGRDWSGFGERAVLGPEDLSPDDQARILSDVLGRPIAFREISLDDFRSSLTQSGLSSAFVEGYVDMMRAKAEGLDNFVARTSDNTTSTTFRRWCETLLKPAVESSEA